MCSFLLRFILPCVQHESCRVCPELPGYSDRQVPCFDWVSNYQTFLGSSYSGTENMN